MKTANKKKRSRLRAADQRAVIRRSLALNLFSIALCLITSACDKPKEPAQTTRAPAVVPVDVQPVGLLEVDRTLPIVGTLFAKDEATIGAEVEGRIEKTLVDFGDRVKAQQELALINTTSYEALARQASANVAKARATAANAEKELARFQELGTIAAPSESDKAFAQAEQARAEVKFAEAAEAVARLNVDRSHVRAPFDAAIAERIASAGDFVKVGEPLFRVVNDAVLKYIVQAPERYAGQIEKGQLVTFTVDAHPGRVFEGKVFLISPQVNTTTRAFGLGALVQNEDRILRANTFARGEVRLQRNVPTPVVSLEAVVNFAGITKVFIIEGGIARAREVQLGRVLDDKQEIVAGLKPGEVIAVTGLTKLYEGARVRVKEQNGKPS